jgi:hypothetical protein
MLWRSTAPARRPEGFVEPSLPTPGHAVPSGPHWAYEIKHDGFRFICRREGNRIRVSSTWESYGKHRAPRPWASARRSMFDAKRTSGLARDLTWRRPRAWRAFLLGLGRQAHVGLGGEVLPPLYVFIIGL